MEKQLLQEKQALESGLSIVENRIMEKVRTTFDVEQTDYGHILEGIRRWYNSLDNNQRDTHAKWHIRESKPLLLHIQKIESLEETFLRKIPMSPEYNLKIVEQWMVDSTNDYTNRLERGKQLIDSQRIKVEAVEITFEGHYEHKTNESIYFRDYICLTFQHTNTLAKIYIAEGNAVDPTDPYAARRQISHGEQLMISENTTLQIAAQHQDGNWSMKQTVKLFVTTQVRRGLVKGRQTR